VLFATHILTLAQEVCRRIGVIIDGRIIVQGGLEELMALAGQVSLEEFYFQTVLQHEKPAEA
jgi:ABC-type multidrug transport system ATPase subunit